MKRRFLVAASDEFELRPLRERLAGRSDADYVFVAGGPGAKLMSAALDTAGSPSAYDAVISVGICGALAPELRVGSVVVGTAVNGCVTSVPASIAQATAGPVASVDDVVGSVLAKQRLRRTGAIAVEMEAAAVQQYASRGGREFYCVKAVSDTADEEFTLDLNAARDRDGRFSVSRIILQAVRRPWTGFPELARLKRNADLAAGALGEFFAFCKF